MPFNLNCYITKHKLLLLITKVSLHGNRNGKMLSVLSPHLSLCCQNGNQWSTLADTNLLLSANNPYLNVSSKIIAFFLRVAAHQKKKNVLYTPITQIVLFIVTWALTTHLQKMALGFKLTLTLCPK